MTAEEVQMVVAARVAVDTEVAGLVAVAMVRVEAARVKEEEATGRVRMVAGLVAELMAAGQRAAGSKESGAMVVGTTAAGAAVVDRTVAPMAAAVVRMEATEAAEEAAPKATADALEGCR